MDGLVWFFIWWVGYAVAVWHYVPDTCSVKYVRDNVSIIDPMELIVFPVLKSIVWPIALPVSWFASKRLKAKQ